MKNRSRRSSSIDVTIIYYYGSEAEHSPQKHQMLRAHCSLLIVRCDHRCSLALIFTPHFEKIKGKNTLESESHAVELRKICL